MNVIFPEDISYGSVSISEYHTTIIETRNGYESRNADWNNERRQFNVREGTRTQKLIEKLMHFFYIVKGRAVAFNYKDWFDYKSTTYMEDTISDTDQIIGSGDGLKTEFQLVKTYKWQGISKTTNIKKPKDGTVVASIQGVSTTAFSVDYDTGIITFDVAPGSTKIIKCGYEFYINCRFKEDKLSANLTTYNIAETSIMLIEVRE